MFTKTIFGETNVENWWKQSLQGENSFAIQIYIQGTPVGRQRREMETFVVVKVIVYLIHMGTRTHFLFVDPKFQRRHSITT